MCVSFRFAVATNAERVLLPKSDAREAAARDVAQSSVLGYAEEGLGENVPETKVHQQTRQEEVGCEARAKRFTGIA